MPMKDFRSYSHEPSTVMPIASIPNTTVFGGGAFEEWHPYDEIHALGSVLGGSWIPSCPSLNKSENYNAL